MKKLFLLLFSVLAFTSQVRADVEWTIFSGELAFGNWENALNGDAYWCKALQEGDIISVTGTIDTGKESDYAVQLYYKDTYISDFTLSEGKFSYTLTATDVENLQAEGNGMNIKGHDFTISSVCIKKAKSAIKKNN